MPQLGEMTLSELRAYARRLLGVPVDATGQYGDAELLVDLNVGCLWLQGKLGHFHQFWRVVKSEPITVGVGVIPFPADMLIEKRLLKRVSTIPEKFEEVEVITSEESDGVVTGATRRERWTTQEASFRFVGTDFTQATYVVEYVQNIPPLQGDTDKPKLPPQWHYAIGIRAAEVNALKVGELDRHAKMMELRKGVEAEIADEATRFAAMRVREHTIRQLPFGTYGYVRENVKQTLVASGKKPADYWTDARLNTVVNNALQEMQIDLMALNPDIFLQRVAVTVTAGTAPLPKDLVRMRLFGKVENGEIRVQTVVPLTESFQHILSLPLVNADQGVVVARAVWTVDAATIRSSIGSSADGEYIMLYEPRMTPLVADDDPLQIPLEHTNTLIAKSVCHGARLVGDMELHDVQASTYGAQIAGVRGRVLQQKHAAKRHRIRDSWGYGLDDMDGAGEWWF